MTQIIRGELKYNELSKNANGGTELMARRMIEHIDNELLQKFQIIHSRIPEKLDDNLFKILVCHDLPQDPMYDILNTPEGVNKFDGFIFVSHWQYNQFMLHFNLPSNKCQVIPNAIEPFGDITKNYNDTVKLIYHTTPHRGLDLLYPAFDYISKLDIDVHLDVFSSFKAYGWPESDKRFKYLFDQLEKHPNITYHGFQPNDVVREKLKETHIFAYPCIWQETSCIAAIEAAAASNIVVTSNYGALPETLAQFGVFYEQSSNNQNNVNAFASKLWSIIKIIKANNSTPLDMKLSYEYFNHFYNVKIWAIRYTTFLRTFND